MYARADCNIVFALVISILIFVIDFAVVQQHDTNLVVALVVAILSFAIDPAVVELLLTCFQSVVQLLLTPDNLRTIINLMGRAYENAAEWAQVHAVFRNVNTEFMLSRAITDRAIWTRNPGPNERLDMVNPGSINLTPSNTSYIAAIWAHHSAVR